MVRTLRVSPAHTMRSWCDQSVPTRSSTTPMRITPPVRTVTMWSSSENRRVLKPGGIYIGLGGGGLEEGGLLGPMVGALKLVVAAPFVSQKLEFFVAELN